MLTLKPEELQRYAAAMLANVAREVPAYSTMDADLREDVATVMRMNVGTFFRCLAADQFPTPEEMYFFEKAAARRPQRHIALESVLLSYRIGIRSMWGFVQERVDPVELGDLAMFTLKYSDLLTGTVAQAYIEQRHRDESLTKDALRLLLTRILLNSDIDAVSAIHDATSLGIDLQLPHHVLVASIGESISASGDAVLSEMRARIEELPGVVSGFLISSGLVVLAESIDRARIEEVVLRPFGGGGAGGRGDGAAAGGGTNSGARRGPRGGVPRGGGPIVGIGTPACGIEGLVRSYHEAQRARTLGAIIQPERALHDYASLRVFDLFRSGDALDTFVSDTIGPILDYESSRQHRLLETLRTLFSCALNRSRTARRLDVHPNTLTARTAAIETALGNIFSSGEQLFRVQLALHLLPLTTLGIAIPSDASAPDDVLPDEL